MRIGDVIRAYVEVKELDAEKKRVQLACECIVDAKTVLDGEATVLVPSRDRTA